MVEEAKKSLRLFSNLLPQEGEEKVEYPRFSELIKYLKDRVRLRVQCLPLCTYVRTYVHIAVTNG